LCSQHSSGGHGTWRELSRWPSVAACPCHLFLLDLTEVVLVSLDGDRMLMQSWQPGQPVTRIARPADGPAEILA